MERVRLEELDRPSGSALAKSGEEELAAESGEFFSAIVSMTSLEQMDVIEICLSC